MLKNTCLKCSNVAGFPSKPGCPLCVVHYYEKNTGNKVPTNCYIKDCKNSVISYVKKQNISLCLTHNAIKTKVKIHRLTNRIEINRVAAKYAKKRRKNINNKLAQNLRTRVSNALRAIKTQKPINCSSIQDLGCSLENLKIYLESKFQAGMTWENYGLKGWHVDHIKPLVKFNLSDPKEFKEACCYTNLQPLWAFDNYSKHSNY